MRRTFPASLAFAALSFAISPPLAFAAPTTFNFESVANNATTFTTSSQSWTTTGFMVGVVATGFGSPAVGTASPTTNAYLDSGVLGSRSLENIGGMKAPAGYTFRALKFDVWPSSDVGGTVYGGTDNTLGTVGLNYTVIGKRNGSQVVSANVTDTARTPPQSGAAVGGYWHHLDLSATAFASTDIDTVEFVLVSQTGIAMNYIAVDNFVYDNFALAAVPTTVTSLNRVNPATTNLSTVNWTLTFAAANAGVTTSNFSLSGAAAAGASVGTPTTANSGLTWNVPVTTGSTAGTLEVTTQDRSSGTQGPEKVADEYFQPSPLINSDDSRVQEIMKTATRGVTDEWDKVVALNNWVSRNLRRKNFAVAFAPASSVARNLSGDCTEHSVLLAALCRAAGIATKTVVGVVYVDSLGGFGFHMWNEVYVNRRWVAVDATFRQSEVDATHIKLGEASLASVAPYESFFTVVRVFNKLTIEPLETE